MIIIRDADTSSENAFAVLEKLSLPAENIAVLDETHDPLVGVEKTEECVILLTTMPNGCMGYQKVFFDTHRHLFPLWIVLLINQDAFIRNQAEAHFHGDGICRRLFLVHPKTDWTRLSAEVKAVAEIEPFHILLYSIRPHCGKKSLAKLLSDSLPGWTFEIREESLESSKFPETRAGHILIVGQTLRDLYTVTLPEGLTPFYILTMPDIHVQAYLRREKLSAQLLQHLPSSMDWTAAAVQTHFFYISPLYEQWRREGADPSLDHRFLLWDDFGLPCPKSSCTNERIRAFLNQFNQCDILAKTLRGEKTRDKGA